MMDEHVCEHHWHIFEESKDGAFCVKGCQGRLSRDEAERRLNEYEKLKKIIKRLTGFPREEWDWLLEYLPEDCRYILEG